MAGFATKKKKNSLKKEAFIMVMMDHLLESV